jgi:DNA-directed RNA polymerase subunit RPC12/RpoP
MTDPEDHVTPPPAVGSPSGPPPLPAPSPLHEPPPLPDGGPVGERLDDDAMAPPPDAEIVHRAMLHQTEQTRTYPCRRCGGDLEFAIREQQLRCPHCGNTEEIVDDEDREVVEQDFRAALAALEQGVLDRTGSQVAGEKEVVCQNCGGHTTFTGSLTATRCPYCATPIQRDDVHDAPSRLAVDGVLPFQVDRTTAEAAIGQWIDSRWFAPNEFKKYSTTGSFTSVYAAYFTYDADTTTRYTGMRGDNYTVTVGSGENRRTEVRTRWSPRSGTVVNRFDDVPVLANEGFDRRHIQALEPWPTERSRPFSAEYVAGHLSRTYDHGVDECFSTARSRIEDDVRETVRRDIGGDHQRISSMSVHYGSLTYKHLLLPIWLLTVMYQQQPFQVFINGVTGEVHGERPWSWVKIAIAVAVALVVLGVLLVLYQGSGGGAR